MHHLKFLELIQQLFCSILKKQMAVLYHLNDPIESGYRLWSKEEKSDFLLRED